MLLIVLPNNKLSMNGLPMDRLPIDKLPTNELSRQTAYEWYADE